MDYFKLAVVLSHWPYAVTEFSNVSTGVSIAIRHGDPKDVTLKTFRLSDDGEIGKIPSKNLRRVAKELGEEMIDEEL